MGTTTLRAKRAVATAYTITPPETRSASEAAGRIEWLATRSAPSVAARSAQHNTDGASCLSTSFAWSLTSRAVTTKAAVHGYGSGDEHCDGRATDLEAPRQDDEGRNGQRQVQHLECEVPLRLSDSLQGLGRDAAERLDQGTDREYPQRGYRRQPFVAEQDLDDRFGRDRKANARRERKQCDTLEIADVRVAEQLEVMLDQRVHREHRPSHDVADNRVRELGDPEGDRVEPDSGCSQYSADDNVVDRAAHDPQDARRADEAAVSHQFEQDSAARSPRRGTPGDEQPVDRRLRCSPGEIAEYEAPHAEIGERKTKGDADCAMDETTSAIVLERKSRLRSRIAPGTTASPRNTSTSAMTRRTSTRSGACRKRANSGAATTTTA